MAGFVLVSKPQLRLAVALNLSKICDGALEVDERLELML